MRRFISGITKKHLFLLGLAVIFLTQIPMFILGTDSIVPYHDQLDGEIISYIYQAKYLFSGNDCIPEFLNGASRTALTPPAPLAVLLFCVMPTFAAYMMMLILGQIVAFWGMFLLADRLTGQKVIALIVGGLYAFLPFLPVYGLSQYGVPMLIICLMNLWQKRYKWQSLLYVVFYTGMSSLVLCGFVWLIILAEIVLLLIMVKKFKAHMEMTAAFLLMSGGYILTNLSLLLQILGIGEQTVSHKSEYVLSGAGFVDLVKDYMINGGDHSTDYHKWILVLAVSVLFLAILSGRKWSERRQRWCKWLLGDIILILILCVLAALWNCYTGVAVRANLGTLGAFQFGRILWIAPTLWYGAFALSLAILCTWEKWWKWLGYGASVVVLGIVGIQLVKGSSVKDCVQEILVPEYETISWSDYFAIGVMDQVEEYIYEDQGLKKSEYKVVSLGIDPVAALYHGFYCLDGYSNNYDVEYKHAFRKVIAPELERNDWLKQYFDEWGNRCYLVSSEIPGYYNIEKGTSWYNDLQINTAALKELGCTYILSAAYIVNAEEIGLELLNNEPVETPESYYLIYIYKIS